MLVLTRYRYRLCFISLNVCHGFFQHRCKPFADCWHGFTPHIGTVLHRGIITSPKWHNYMVSMKTRHGRIQTRWVDGTPTTEVTPVSIWWIHTPDLGHQMVMVMVVNDLLPPPLCNVNPPSHYAIQLFQNLTMKIHGQGHVCGQRWRSHLTFKFQRSMSWSRSNLMVTFEALSSIDMFAFRFVAIGPFLAEI